MTIVACKIMKRKVLYTYYFTYYYLTFKCAAQLTNLSQENQYPMNMFELKILEAMLTLRGDYLCICVLKKVV